MNAYTVVENVQVVIGKVYDLFAITIFDPRLTNVPLLWDHPIEHLGTGRNFIPVERYDLRNNVECFTNAVARNAPTKWKKTGNEINHQIPLRRGSFGRCRRLYYICVGFHGSDGQNVQIRVIPV